MPLQKRENQCAQKGSVIFCQNFEHRDILSVMSAIYPRHFLGGVYYCKSAMIYSLTKYIFENHIFGNIFCFRFLILFINFILENLFI